MSTIFVIFNRCIFCIGRQSVGGKTVIPNKSYIYRLQCTSWFCMRFYLSNAAKKNTKYYYQTNNNVHFHFQIWDLTKPHKSVLKQQKLNVSIFLTSIKTKCMQTVCSCVLTCKWNVQIFTVYMLSLHDIWGYSSFFPCWSLLNRLFESVECWYAVLSWKSILSADPVKLKNNPLA